MTDTQVKPLIYGVPHYFNAPFADLVQSERLTLAKADPDAGGMCKVTPAVWRSVAV